MLLTVYYYADFLNKGEVNTMLEQNNENMIEFLRTDKTCTISLTSQKYINRVKKLYEKAPEQFEAYKINPDGSLYARIPLKWVKITIPRVKEMTEEQKQIAAERFRKYRENKNQQIDEEDIEEIETEEDEFIDDDD